MKLKFFLFFCFMQEKDSKREREKERKKTRITNKNFKSKYIFGFDLTFTSIDYHRSLTDVNWNIIVNSTDEILVNDCKLITTV